MKKTIAKMMAATMLVASMPAMVMPTLTVDAAGFNSNDSVSVTAVKFNGSFDNGKVIVDDAWYPSGTSKITNASKTALGLRVGDGMTMTTGSTGVWNTHLQFFNDNQADTHTTTFISKMNTTPSNKITNTDLTAGSMSITKLQADATTGVYNAEDVKKIGDYYDQTGTVKSIKLDANGEMIVTLDTTKLTTDKLKELAAGNNNLIEFTPWIPEESATVYSGYLVRSAKLAEKPVFTIQVGETFTAKKTQITGASTSDGFVKNATVTIDGNYKATLVKVPSEDKKTTMKGQKIDLSNIEVGGIEYPIVKFEEQALKSAKMKRLTAKNVKNLEGGCVRGCKKLTKVNMGGAKMRKIHSNAFYDCEKLKNIKINVKNLKSVGSKSFMKLHNNCTISLKAGTDKKYKEVVKKIKRSGVNKVKFKKA